jgi:transporter family protein
MWLIFSLLSAVSAALVAILGKLGLKNVDSTLATTIRSVIMALFLLIVSVLLKRWKDFSFSSFSSKDWLLIVLAGVAGAVSWLFYFAALKLGLASKVAAVDRLSLVFVVIFSALFLGEDFHIKTLLGALLMFGGVLLITA